MWNLFNPLWWWRTIIDPFEELGPVKEPRKALPPPKKPKRKKAIKIGNEVYVKDDMLSSSTISKDVAEAVSATNNSLEPDGCLVKNKDDKPKIVRKKQK